MSQIDKVNCNKGLHFSPKQGMVESDAATHNL